MPDGKASAEGNALRTSYERKYGSWKLDFVVEPTDDDLPPVRFVPHNTGRLIEG
jgi:hypothetical protein